MIILMKKLITILLLIISTNVLFAQKEGNIWYFGDSAGVSFNTGTPIALLNGMTFTHETSSTICDNNGNLLFYTGAFNYVPDKINVWNKNGQVILNGTDLYGDYSMTQGTLLLPAPLNNNLIYLFQIRRTQGIYYSVIDKAGDGGRGAITIKNKPLYLNDSITEKMVAVRHANGRDWWIIAHKGECNTFLMYLLQKDTIMGPFEQNIGSTHTGLGDIGYWGQMCISKNGDKLVCVTIGGGIIDVFDFDRCNAMLSNLICLSNNENHYYGCSISPNNSKLYVSTHYIGEFINTRLFQFDLLASDIPTSKTEIANLPYQIHFFGQHKLGIDDKIYIDKISGQGFPNDIYDSNNMFLSIIEQPNLQGTSCQFNLNGLYLGGVRSEYGLPNIPNYALGAVEGSACDTIPEPPPPHETEAVIYIPNIFSPNGDGQNDVFRLRSEQIASVHLMVYNRWGNMVFESNDMSYAWDGMYQGKACEVGVYAWMAEIVMKNGTNLFRKGNVSLVR